MSVNPDPTYEVAGDQLTIVERAGADLNIYYCPTRGRFSRLYTVPGVGVGVGFVGLRFERTGGVITQSALIPAYRESLTSVP